MIGLDGIGISCTYARCFYHVKVLTCQHLAVTQLCKWLIHEAFVYRKKHTIDKGGAHLTITLGHKVMITINRNIHEGTSRILLPFLHISTLYCSVILAIKWSNRQVQGRQRCMLILHCHHDVTHPNGCNFVEESIISLHFLKASEIAFLEDLCIARESFMAWCNWHCVPNHFDHTQSFKHMVTKLIAINLVSGYPIRVWVRSSWWLTSMRVSFGKFFHPLNLPRISSKGAGSLGSRARVIYSFMTATEYKCGGDAAATNKATALGANMSCSTIWQISYARIAPKHVPKSAYGLSCKSRYYRDIISLAISDRVDCKYSIRFKWSHASLGVLGAKT